MIRIYKQSRPISEYLFDVVSVGFGHVAGPLLTALLQSQEAHRINILYEI